MYEVRVGRNVTKMSQQSHLWQAKAVIHISENPKLTFNISHNTQ